MGWTHCYKPKHQNLTEFFIQRGVLSWSQDLPHTYKVLDSALVNFHEYYAAIEKVNKSTGERQVWAAIILVNFRKDGQYNLLWKEMCESMGPHYFNCPKRILDLLTATSDENALSWRAACFKNIERLNGVKQLSDTLKIGNVIKFNHPIKFTNGLEETTFTVSSKRTHEIVFDGIYSIKKDFIKLHLDNFSAQLVA